MSVLEKFLSYIQISSPSNEDCEECPSTKEQLQVADFLAQEMTKIGLTDIRIDKGYVYGHLQASDNLSDKPCIGFIAHMDTAPEFNGFNIKPQIISEYDGEDVLLKGSGDILSPKDFPELKKLKGHTLVTTDGTTLLGVDDKAGIAIILQAIEDIINENRPHCKIAVAFTPDEEIGRGADLFDVTGFGAKFAYTVDGGLPGEIEYENFNACSASVTVMGRSIHPGTAKGIMINSQGVAFEFNALLPEFEKPEYTEGFEGFYHLIETIGATEKTILKYIIRDHDAVGYEKKKSFLKEAAMFLNKKYSKELVTVDIKESYRNMKEQILPVYHLIENAQKAIVNAELKVETMAIRGGTDGARLSFMGLPCPNLGAGGMNYHGKYECTTKENLDACKKVILEIVSIYSMD